MMEPRQVAQCALFYEFSIEEHVPDDHLLRQIDRFVDISTIRPHLAPHYSAIGRPSVDPQLMIRMLFVGYCMGMRYRASKKNCDICELKSRCCPKEPARKLIRSIHKGARDMARDITKTDAYVAASYARKKVEMLFARLKRILNLDRLRLRGPGGTKDEFLLAATTQNLRKLAKLIPSSAEGAY